MPTIKDGVITTDFNSTNDTANCIIIQPDGKLVVAGSTADAKGNSKFALVRYNSNGSLDNSFDGDGKVTTAINFNDYANSVIIQSGDKLVVVGYSKNPSGNNDFALVRYNIDGSLDTSFGSNGKMTTDFGNNDYANSVIVQPDGKLVVAGFSITASGNNDFALARYKTDGSLDSSFDGDGKVTTAINPILLNSSTDKNCSVVIQPDGKLVVAGSLTSSGAKNNFDLVRYNTDGSLDSSFNGDGKVTTDINAESVITQPDGKLVVVGSSALARYNPNGSLDSTFGNNGKATLSSWNTSNTANSAHSVVIQSDGKLVVIGSSLVADAGYDGFTLARYNTDGSLDMSFHGDGKAKTMTVSSVETGYSVIVQPDAKLLAAVSTSYDFGIIRYNADGSLDTSFSGWNTMGTAKDDLLKIGTTASDSIVGLTGNDTLWGLAGNDTLDGGVGTDTALYMGDVRANFTVQHTAPGFTVTDKTGVEGIDTLIDIEKIYFVSDNTAIRLDISSTSGQVYRFYSAFDRTPDVGGLGFWIDAMDKGASLPIVANGFVNSSEFLTLYGLNSSPETFLTKLYHNVLHRAYDQSGFDFWLSTLNSGANSQAAVLAQFSESPENQDAVIGSIFNGVEYTPYIPIL